MEDRQPGNSGRRNAKRIATLDIGTNSVRLLVADIDRSGRIVVSMRRGEVTRLGEGLERNGEISIAARDRTGAVVASFVEEARKWGASDIVVAGTGALRSAPNGANIAEHFSRLANLPVRILSGEEEAKLVFDAVSCPPWKQASRCIVLDIGGGSTEIISGSSGKIDDWNSVEIGCVRLTERTISHDPPLHEELGKARDEVARALRAVEVPEPGGHLHCVGGTVTTFASIDKKLTKHEPHKIEGVKMSRESVESIERELSALRLEERMKIPGLSPGRADIIIAGGVILSETLNHLKFKEFIVSTRGLRYGLLGTAGK
ncbi:MAG: Ppx/GppA phosphatase family protein [Candidatus Eisenbacteria bacterium]|nr:Ppx/GppA phosphatase family protein [Candidatus Eisenbacteria bacterium]